MLTTQYNPYDIQHNYWMKPPPETTGGGVTIENNHPISRPRADPVHNHGERLPPAGVPGPAQLATGGVTRHPLEAPISACAATGGSFQGVGVPGLPTHPHRRGGGPSTLESIDLAAPTQRGGVHGGHGAHQAMNA